MNVIISSGVKWLTFVDLNALNGDCEFFCTTWHLIHEEYKKKDKSIIELEELKTSSSRKTNFCP